MSTFQAIIYILKSLIDLGMYLTKTIKHNEYVERLKKMDDSIFKATNGELGERLQGGRDVEDQINSHVRGGKR